MALQIVVVPPGKRIPNHITGNWVRKQDVNDYKTLHNSNLKAGYYKQYSKSSVYPLDPSPPHYFVGVVWVDDKNELGEVAP